MPAVLSLEELLSSDKVVQYLKVGDSVFKVAHSYCVCVCVCSPWNPSF